MDAGHHTVLHNVRRPAPRSPPDRDGVEVVDSDLLLGLLPAPAAAPPGRRRPLAPSPAPPVHVRPGPRLRVSRRASSGRHPAPVLGRCVRLAIPAAAASGLRRRRGRPPARPEGRAAVAGGQPGRRAGPQPGAGQAAHALYHQPLTPPSGAPLASRPRPLGHGGGGLRSAVCGGAWGRGRVRHCCGGERERWEMGRRSRQLGEGPPYFPVLPLPLPLRGASTCPYLLSENPPPPPPPPGAGLAPGALAPPRHLRHIHPAARAAPLTRREGEESSRGRRGYAPLSDQ